MRTLLRALKKHYRLHRRDLPWRNTRDPYKILVSELMLQQTQVKRVVPYYKKFIKHFPSAGVLSRAKLKDVLALWQGLGYNRRARFLHEASKIIAKRGFPKQIEEIEELPGVGRYTARAIAAFAWNSPEIFLETNIRTVFFYHFHSNVLQNVRMSDAELLPLVAETLARSKMRPRDFYAAVMDYGSSLKREGVRLNKKSLHYAKQSKFEGSARQVRGAILRELLRHRATLAVLAHKIPRNQHDLAHELARLMSEGLVALHGRYFSIPD